MQTMFVVLHRLDVAATRAVDPPGPPAAGYDDDFREPVRYDSGGLRQTSRRELAAVRVPCQIETAKFEELRQMFTGDAPSSNMVVVLHRRDLARLGLIDAATGRPTIRTNDRVSALERKTGGVARTLGDEGLFVFEVRPASFGFGPDGYDLELLYLNDRERARA